MWTLRPADGVLLFLLAIAAPAAGISLDAPLSTWKNYSMEQRKRAAKQVAEHLELQEEVGGEVQLPMADIFRCVDYNRPPDEQGYGGKIVRMTVAGAVQVCIQTFVPGLRAKGSR